MVNGETANESLWTKAKTTLVALTSVLVVVPALINAGVDIYNSIQKIPRTNEERINAELFKTYFNIPPAVTVPVPVKTDLGQTEMRLSVYAGGDILVEYGSHLKWFPSPLKEKQVATAEPGWFSEALADPLGDTLKGAGKYTQKDTATSGNTILRERYFENGVKESFTIDVNTGRVSDRKVSPAAITEERPKGVNVINYPMIDVESAGRKAGTP